MTFWGEARTGSKTRLSNRPKKRWNPPGPTWQEGGGICTLLLNLVFEPLCPSPLQVIWLGGSWFGRPSREGQGDLEGTPDYPMLNRLLFKRAGEWQQHLYQMLQLQQQQAKRTPRALRRGVLSPTDLVHRDGRVAVSIVWVTVMLPLPARRRNRGGWGRKSLSMSTWDVLECAARSEMIVSFAPVMLKEGWAVEGRIWHSVCSWHLCELQRFEKDLKMI